MDVWNWCSILRKQYDIGWTHEWSEFVVTLMDIFAKVDSMSNWICKPRHSRNPSYVDSDCNPTVIQWQNVSWVVIWDMKLLSHINLSPPKACFNTYTLWYYQKMFYQFFWIQLKVFFLYLNDWDYFNQCIKVSETHGREIYVTSHCLSKGIIHVPPISICSGTTHHPTPYNVSSGMFLLKHDILVTKLSNSCSISFNIQYSPSSKTWQVLLREMRNLKN